MPLIPCGKAVVSDEQPVLKLLVLQERNIHQGFKAVRQGVSYLSGYKWH